MNDEERRLITGFVERIAGAQQPQGAWGGGQPQQQALPPVDPEADRHLWELFNRYPEARYRITQTAFVQEAALIEAQNRIRQLEWEVENARRQGQAMASQASAPRGAFGGLFGGGRPSVPAPAPMPPPPQPQYPPGYNPGQMQQAQGRSGMGFLGTAAAAAAGVAGGMMLGNMLTGAFGGGHAHASGLGGMGGGAGTIPTSASWGGDKGGSPWDAGGDKGGGSSAWGQDQGGQSSSWGQDQGGDSSSSWGQSDQGGSSGWGQADAAPDGAGYASDNGGSSDWGGGGGSSDWGGSEET